MNDLSIYLSVCLSIYLSTYLPIYTWVVKPHMNWYHVSLTPLQLVCSHIVLPEANTHICAYIYTVYIYILVCIYMYIYMCIYMYIYMCIYIYMYVYMYVCLYIHMYIYIWLWDKPANWQLRTCNDQVYWPYAPLMYPGWGVFLPLIGSLTDINSRGRASRWQVRCNL